MGTFVFKKRRLNVRENLGKCFDLTALHKLPSHSSVFTFCFASFNFFYDGI